MKTETVMFRVPVEISYDPSYRGARAAVVKDAKEHMRSLGSSFGAGEFGEYKVTPRRGKMETRKR